VRGGAETNCTEGRKKSESFSGGGGQAAKRRRFKGWDYGKRKKTWIRDSKYEGKEGE